MWTRRFHAHWTFSLLFLPCSCHVQHQDTIREEMEFLHGRMADAEAALKEARAETESVDKCVHA